MILSPNVLILYTSIIEGNYNYKQLKNHNPRQHIYHKNRALNSFNFKYMHLLYIIRIRIIFIKCTWKISKYDEGLNIYAWKISSQKVKVFYNVFWSLIETIAQEHLLGELFGMPGSTPRFKSNVYSSLIASISVDYSLYDIYLLLTVFVDQLQCPTNGNTNDATKMSLK